MRYCMVRGAAVVAVLAWSAASRAQAEPPLPRLMMNPQVQEFRRRMQQLIRAHDAATRNPQLLSQVRAQYGALVADHPNDPDVLWGIVDCMDRMGAPDAERELAYLRDLRAAYAQYLVVEHREKFSQRSRASARRMRKIDAEVVELERAASVLAPPPLEAIVAPAGDSATSADAMPARSEALIDRSAAVAHAVEDVRVVEEVAVRAADARAPSVAEPHGDAAPAADPSVAPAPSAPAPQPVVVPALLVPAPPVVAEVPPPASAMPLAPPPRRAPALLTAVIAQRALAACVRQRIAEERVRGELIERGGTVVVVYDVRALVEHCRTR